MAATDPAATQQALQLVQAQEATRAVAAAQIAVLAEESVRQFHGWYNTAAITRWATDLAKQIEAVQKALVRSTDAYLARMSSLITGRRVPPVGAVDVATLRNGVTHPGVYGRMADTYRYQEFQLKTDPSLVQPLDAALARAEVAAALDTQLAVTKQSQAFMAAQKTITGYRRVIHPELSKGTCGLCIAASDRLYGPIELMPIHARCNCLPIPIYDDNDPGSALNEGDLARLYKEAGDTTSGKKLKRTRYQVTEHGELGPLLTEKGTPVRTAATAARDETH